MGYILFGCDILLSISDMLGVPIDVTSWGEAGKVPYYLNELYRFSKVYIDNVQCIFAEPRGDIPATQALAKHFSTISAAASIPVVLHLNGLSLERLKALTSAHIPFATPKQLYLPFMGVVMQRQLYGEPTQREKLMPSSQLLLLAYLYQKNRIIQASPIAAKIGVSTMQITRATRQLQKLGLFDVFKEGVQVMMQGKVSHRALFEEASKYFVDPVREVLYVPLSSNVQELPLAGISVLSKMTNLSEPDVPTYAFYSKTDRLTGENGLIDTESQVRVEVWKYPPTHLSAKQDAADLLSVIVSLKDERQDERIEQAIESIFKNLWG